MKKHLNSSFYTPSRLIQICCLTLGLTSATCLASSASANIQSLGCPDKPSRIVVMGDSLADGLWGAIHRSFAQCSTLEVVRLTQVSDGLAKSGADVWLDRYNHAIPDRKTGDIVIVQIGANDIRSLRTGNRRVTFGTEDWTKAYAARAKTLGESLSKRADRVFWFGLPVVGNSNNDRSYRTISEILKDVLKFRKNKKLTFIDVYTLTQFGSDTFTMNAKVNGRIQQMRAPDRVHFTKTGYDYVIFFAIQKHLGKALKLRKSG